MPQIIRSPKTYDVCIVRSGDLVAPELVVAMDELLVPWRHPRSVLVTMLPN
jgi:hypothetical protein